MKSVAVIGQGFVGGSLTTVFAERGATVYVYDKAAKVAEGGTDILEQRTAREYAMAGVSYHREPGEPTAVQNFVKACEEQEDFSRIYFVCLPTPMFEDGAADLSIVDRVLNELSSVPGDRIAVVKSTVPPGSVDRWNRVYSKYGLHVVFSPEFLTEANALDDMRNQNRIILGGPRPWINQVKQVFSSAFPQVPIVKTSSTVAECVKYFTNIQLATRVVLSCEFKQVCDVLDANGLDVDYDKVLEYAKYDPRLGDTHMNVPGKDGVPGARGHCFPKDLNAFIDIAKKCNVSPTVMEAVWKKNLELVPPEHRDWEKMLGRAVSKREK